MQKADGVVFFGGGEVYICDPSDFTVLRLIKTGANGGTCHSILQAPADKLLAFADTVDGDVKLVDLNADFADKTFAPYKDHKPPSFLSFCESVG